MSVWNVKTIILILGLFLVVGCSDAKPTVGFLKAVDKFEFTSLNVTTSSLNSIPLHASCTSFLTNIEVSFDGSTWIPTNTYDSNSKTNCDGGSYNVAISNLTSPLNAMTINSGDTFPVQFRGSSRLGGYVQRTVQIKFAPAETIPQAILAGTETSSGSGLVLKGRALALKQTTSSGTGLKLKGRIVQ